MSPIFPEFDRVDVEEPVCYEIPPPPEAIFPSHDAAEDAIHAWTSSHGFNVSRRRARYTDSAKTILWARNYECDRAGAPPPPPSGDRPMSKNSRPGRGSTKIGCPMRMKIAAVRKDNTQGPWKIEHTSNNSSVHNHPPSTDIRVHAAHRRRAIASTTARDSENESSKTTAGLIAAQNRAGIAPASIFAALVSSGQGAGMIPKDIANARYTARRRDLASQTPMEAVLSRLTEAGFFHEYDLHGDTKELRYLFWAQPTMAKYYKLHPEVLILDCTYKTNSFNLPLLNIIAMSGMNTVVPVAQCWLPGEKEEDFIWALSRLRELQRRDAIDEPNVIVTDRDLACMNALDVVFPTTPKLLCRWHINRNVLAKTRLEFGQIAVENPAPSQDKFCNSPATDLFMSTFYAAVDSATESEFNSKCLQLRQISAVLSAYLDRHWWKYKARIVRCWTDCYKHFGYQTTSAVEGTHAKCKAYIQTSRGDLLVVFWRLIPWWERCESDLKYDTAKDKAITPRYLQYPRYHAVVRIITCHALRETHELGKTAAEIIIKRKARTLCTGSFRRVHGRPCVHELVRLIESSGESTLRPQDFDYHWCIKSVLDEEISVTRVLNPRIIRTTQHRHRQPIRDRRRNHGLTRTGREPTWPERVDFNNRHASPASNSSSSGVYVLPPLPRASESSYPDPALLGALQHGQAIENRPMLPSIDSLLTNVQASGSSSEVVDSRTAYLESPQPTRAWGYAGRNPWCD